MAQRPDLDSVIETTIVDACDDYEQYTAFLTVIEEQTPMPTTAMLLGSPVTVTGFDHPNEARGLVAVCEIPAGVGDVTSPTSCSRPTPNPRGSTPPTGTTRDSSRFRPDRAQTGPGRAEPRLTVRRRCGQGVRRP